MFPLYPQAWGACLIQRTGERPGGQTSPTLKGDVQTTWGPTELLFPAGVCCQWAVALWTASETTDL